jgi:4-amino-4-deoxy-L-arabinose transferase-like glycosyltransferase
MNGIALQRWLRYYLQRLGLIGGLGLALLLLTVLAWAVLVRAAEHQIQSDLRKVAALRQQVAAKSNLPVNTALDREEQLRVFYNGFAKADTVPDTLKHIYQAAAKQALTLDTGEYARLQTGPERLARLRVSLPVKGSFKQVLGFMDQVLQDNSTVALENAVFKRDKIDDDALEAKLVFLVFVDAQP